jgi:hypothetical protein
MYTLREKLAYSKLGKLIATALRNKVYKGSRVHWVQQAMAELNFSGLNK